MTAETKLSIEVPRSGCETRFDHQQLSIESPTPIETARYRDSILFPKQFCGSLAIEGATTAIFLLFPRELNCMPLLYGIFATSNCRS